MVTVHARCDVVVPTLSNVVVFVFDRCFYSDRVVIKCISRNANGFMIVAHSGDITNIVFFDSDAACLRCLFFFAVSVLQAVCYKPL